MSDRSWRELFSQKGGRALCSKRVLVFRRRGSELFAVSGFNSRSCASIDLYLPQTPRARAAKRLWGFLLGSRLGALLGREKITIENTEFSRFVGGPGLSSFPDFAVLSGNPGAAGRRFVFLVLPRGPEPCFVVKAGLGEASMDLIERECNLLEQISDLFPGVPAVRGIFRTDPALAFKTDWFAPPKPALGIEDIMPLLRQWIWTGERARWGDLEVLPRGFLPVTDTAKTFHPVLFHGDLAPWNIRTNGDAWVAVDWEKGWVKGPPLWDLLHFVTMPALLVHKESPKKIRARIDNLLGDPIVGSYLSECGCLSDARMLVRGYFAYLAKTFRPTDGVEKTEELRLMAEAAYL